MAVGDIFDVDKLRYIVLTESGTTGTVSVGCISKSVTTGDIVIPETVVNSGSTYTVTQIRNENSGNLGFYDCNNITTIYISKTITNTSNGGYYNIFYGATKLRSINVDPENSVYYSEDGIWYTKNKKTILKYPEGKLDDVYILPNETTTFENSACLNAGFKYLKYDENKQITINNGFVSHTKKMVKFEPKVNVTVVGSTASNFNNASNIKSIIINIPNLGRGNTFASMSSLRKVHITNNVTGAISSTPFINTLNIEEVYVDSQYVVDNFKNIFPQITSSTSPLKYVNIGDSVTSIGANAFLSGSSLREVHLGKNVERIRQYAFAGCNNLHYIYGNIINENDSQCFTRDKLYKTEISKKSRLYNGIPFFRNFSNIIVYNHNENYNYILRRLFDDCSYARKIIINDENNAINDIQEYVFRSCSRLKNLTIPKAVLYLTGSCFASDSSLESVVFNGNCPSTDSESTPFSGSNNPNLKVYYYQDTIGWESTFAGKPTQKIFRGEVTVDNYTYKFVDGIGGTPNVSVRVANNIKLTANSAPPQTVTIEGLTYTVRYIADNGFENQYNLGSFDFHNQYLEIGKNAFKGCRNLTSVSNTNGITDIYEGAFDGCSKLTSFSIQSISDVYHPIYKNTFRGCKNLQSITLSDYTYEIHESAFEGCSNLKNITIPNETNKIYPRAFKNCTALETVTFGTNLYHIYNEAFMNCENLTSFTPSSTNNIRDIDEKAFYNCHRLTTAPIDNIRTIGKYAFYNCGMETITIPATADYIDNYAFANCNDATIIDNSPTNVEYGTMVFDGYLQ